MASGASSEQESRHSRQVSLEEVEGGGVEGVPRGRGGVEMSPLPEVLHEQRYGAMEEAMHVGGAGPRGVSARVRPAAVRYEPRGGAGNMPRVYVPEGHGDQVLLLPEQGQNRQGQAGFKVCCKKYRAAICE